MKANEHIVQSLLSPVHQFQIPLFQRAYVWDRKNWQQLWDDLKDLTEGEPSETHFMGSFVCLTIPTVPGQVPQFLVIDGQQRMITFAILFSSIRDLARELGASPLAAEVDGTYLLNQYKGGNERYKVLPRLRDRNALFGVIDTTPVANNTSLITPGHKFFLQAIRSYVNKDMGSLSRLCNSIISRVSFVMITLDKENPFAIFESLNGSGQKLEESDLIRNQVFMQMPLDEQDSFDQNYWQPFESSMSAEQGIPAIPLTDFYRDFLMKSGGHVKRGSVYVKFKEHIEHLGNSALIVSSLNSYAGTYRWLYRPRTTPDNILKLHLSRMSRINITTSYPLLLHIIEFWKTGAIDESQLETILEIVQSYLIRRQIAGLSKQSYWFHFSEAIKATSSANSNVVDGLVKLLDRVDGEGGWPSDDIVLERLKSYPIYQSAPELARLILQAVEESYGHKEVVEIDQLISDRSLTLEHVLPQQVGDDDDGQAWKDMLGIDWERTHQQYVHTIGNLTLTGYNSPLANRAFASKRPTYANSNLELNRCISRNEAWDAAVILTRSQELGRKLVELWPSARAFP